MLFLQKTKEEHGVATVFPSLTDALCAGNNTYLDYTREELFVVWCVVRKEKSLAMLHSGSARLPSSH